MRILTLAASLIAAITAFSSYAQTFPERPIRMVLGFSAGGPTDVIARTVARDISEILKQNVIVENRTGASGIIATDFVAQSEPDGYTLLFTAHTHLVNPILMEKVRFDPITDFTPITLVSRLPLLLITHKPSPLNSVSDIVQAAKKDPGKLTYASAGVGSSGHLGGALFQMLSDTDMLHVPFKGNANAIVEVIAGRVSFVFFPMIGVANMVAQDQVKVLAAGTEQRHPDFPGVPTMAEAGYAGFLDTVPWLGVVAPANTPAAIVEKIQSAIHQSLNKQETRDRLRQLGAIIVTNTSSEFRQFLVQDSQRWAGLIQAAGVKGN